MQELPHTRSCFVCGEVNPLGLRLRFHTDGRIVRTEFTPSPEHSGFKQVVHGGIIATILDEIMVWACAVATRQFGFCAEMALRFQSPLRPGQTAVAIAELVANRRNRVFEAKAELRDSTGTLLASATGKYLPIRAADLAELAADMVGDAGMFRAKDSENTR
jgi:uncharacterized protein (TIGR00369 family)